MKKTILILGMLYSCGILFSQTLIYEDDFEQYTSGQFPSTNWEPWHNCSSDPSNNVITSIGENSLQV